MKWEKLLEFLFENGFRVIARDSEGLREAKAYESMPSCKETAVYRIWEDFEDIRSNSESRIFRIDLSCDDSLIGCGECLYIWDLLNKNDK